MIESLSQQIRTLFKSRLAKNQLLFILAFSSLITLAGTLLQLIFEYRDDINYIDTQIKQIENSYLGSLSNSLWTLDDKQIEIQMNNMLSLRDIIYLEITEGGKTLYGTSPSHVKSDRIESFPMVHDHQGAQITIGELRVHASFGGVYQRMVRRIVVILSTQGLKTFFVSLFILYILHRHVIRYLIKIAEYAQGLKYDSLDMTLDIHRRPASQPDEFNTLVDSINAMRHRLSSDIIRRKQTEEALQLSLEKFEKTFQTAPIWVVLSSMEDGRYIEVNDAIIHTTGYQREELIGETSIELDTWVNKSDRDLIVSEVKQNGSIKNIEVQRKTKSSQIIDTLFSAGTLQLDGKPIMISVSQDITEQKKAAAERRHLQTQLLQSQKIESIGRLAGGVAHDLNNLLSPILGYAEMLLLDTTTEDPRRDTLQEIIRAALRARDLVHQLLAFSRKQTMAFKSINMNTMVQNFDSLLRRTIREDISININLAAEMPPIMGDTGQLEQVIMNLAVNAQDAMPQGGKLTIETARMTIDEAYANRHEGLTAGTFSQFTVSDTGCGMDTQTFDKMFEPFYTTKAKGRGTGLGLATVYGIVKQHNGNIWAYSEPNQGSTFKVLLPICEASPAEAQACAPIASAETNGTEHILLVEDNEQVRILAYTLLKRNGYTVLVAQDGPEALDLLKEHAGPLHLLLTDVVMPKMNGKQLFEKVAAAYPGVKVLYMSGYTENVITQRGVIDAGINFLHKPFTIASLSAKVREVLNDSV